MSDTRPRTERSDFQETATGTADVGRSRRVGAPEYRSVRIVERQHWARRHRLNQDRLDWQERIERRALPRCRMSRLRRHQRVRRAGPRMRRDTGGHADHSSRRSPTSATSRYLTASTARGVLDQTPADGLERTPSTSTTGSGPVRRDAASRVTAWPSSPRHENLVEAVRLPHVIEGMIPYGQHVSWTSTTNSTLPASSPAHQGAATSTATSRSRRSCATWRASTTHLAAIQRAMVEVGPSADAYAPPG